MVLVCNALIQPYFDYCCEVWDTLGKGLSERLQKLQNRAARLIMNLKNEHGHSVLARNSLGWELLEKRRVEMKARIMYKTVNKQAPSRLCDLFQNVNKINDYNLRGSSTRVYIPMPKTEFLKQSFCYDGAKIWNQLPDEIRNSASLTSFCSKSNDYESDIFFHSDIYCPPRINRPYQNTSQDDYLKQVSPFLDKLQNLVFSVNQIHSRVRWLEDSQRPQPYLSQHNPLFSPNCQPCSIYSHH